MIDTWTWQHARPKYATPYNPTATTDGHRQALIADGMGKSFMEWQRYTACVAGERTAFGNLRYEIVIVTVPRQSGKTTLVGPVQIDTVISTPNVKTFYTAQTGKDARSRFTDLVNLVKSSPMSGVAKFRYSAGDEGIIFPNGSAIKIFAPTEQALHGETPPKVTLDEIWAFEEAFGDAMLEDAILPAQMTLEGIRQVWMISTAGTALSTFMKKWVDRGRASVLDRLAGGNGGQWAKIAYFEWGLPEGGDPYDLETIAAFHPAVGYTVTAEGLLAYSANMARAKWLRSFCNVWTEAADPVVSMELWDSLVMSDRVKRPTRREIAITYEVAPDNECAAVMASWVDARGTPCSRVLHAAPGTTWLVDFLVTLYTQWQPAVFGADDGGPTRVVTAELRRRLKDPEGEKVRTLNAREFGTACVALLGDIRDKNFRHDGSKTLRYNIANLALKHVNDVIRFSRSDSTAPIAGIIAAAVGIFLFQNKPAPMSKPKFRSA